MTKDPFRYFRIEAHELVDALARGLLELDPTRAPTADAVKALLRHAHTLKGAARVVKLPELGDLAHQLEDVLVPLRESPRAPTQDELQRAQVGLDAIRAALSRLGRAPDEAPPTPSEAAPTRVDEPVESAFAQVRVGIADLDALVDGLGDARVACAALVRALEQADTGDHRALVDRARKLAATLDEVHTSTSDLRLVPTQALATELERAARDAASAHGKRVELRLVGADARLDAPVLAGLRGALRHLVTNAVVHGIEAPTVRARIGKPEIGRVEITFRREGARVAITCRDDGAGLDFAALRAAAAVRGRELPDDDALIAALLAGGLSSAARTDDIAGRGIGLDVVRQSIAALDGELAITSRPGGGTTVSLRVPLSLAAVAALAVECGGDRVYVPLEAVSATRHLAAGDLVRRGDAEHLVVVDGVLPFVPLATLLSRGTRRDTPRVRAALLLEVGDARAAIGVERVGAIETIVTKPLPPAPIDPLVGAVTLDGDGRACLVLAAAELVQRAREATAPLPSAPREPPLVLVVDDSLTSRMLEQSILESAGYRVALASSAEEALELLARGRFDALVVDVEMPGMSGFELLEKLQREPSLGAPPAVLVTSRADPADLLRGRQAGARDYIVKGDFDQRRLLDVLAGIAA